MNAVKVKNIENFEEWKEIWDKNPFTEVRMGLIHSVIENSFKRSKENCPYKENDKIHSFYFDILINASQKIEKFSSKSDNLLEKVFTVLIDRVFGDMLKNHKNSEFSIAYYIRSEAPERLGEICKLFSLLSSGLDKDAYLSSKFFFILRKYPHRKEIIRKILIAFYETSLNKDFIHIGEVPEKYKEQVGLLPNALIRLMNQLSLLDYVFYFHRDKCCLPTENILQELEDLALSYVPYRSRIHFFPITNSNLGSYELPSQSCSIERSLIQGSPAADCLIRLRALKKGIEVVIKEAEADLAEKLKASQKT